MAFTLGDSLAPPDALCRAVVIVPARNEEKTLAGTLDALRLQATCAGQALDQKSFEILLLLNNCTDGSVAVARQYAAKHPDLRLHAMNCVFEAERAHVGTARSLLMDLACRRLESLGGSDVMAILSTDADTSVAPDWIARNLMELEAGADVVGGVISLFAHDLESLEPQVHRAYLHDRALQALVAKLESLLDPDPADPWPRHLEHFGASLACTPEVYRRSGGLPPVKPLEDVAFVDALRRAGAKIRHSPWVRIHTSARLDGRAEVGLSGQLRHWQHQATHGLPHMVDSAEWLEHRFSTLARLRRFNEKDSESPCAFPGHWHEALVDSRSRRLITPQFLAVLNCDALIDEMFIAIQGKPARRAEITAVISRLEEIITSFELARAHQP